MKLIYFIGLVIALFWAATTNFQWLPVVMGIVCYLMAMLGAKAGE